MGTGSFNDRDDMTKRMAGSCSDWSLAALQDGSRWQMMADEMQIA